MKRVVNGKCDESELMNLIALGFIGNVLIYSFL